MVTGKPEAESVSFAVHAGEDHRVWSRRNRRQRTDDVARGRGPAAAGHAGIGIEGALGAGPQIEGDVAGTRRSR